MSLVTEISSAEINLIIGETLVRTRKQRDRTQAELARALGLSPQQMSRLERGVNILTAEKLYRLSLFLEVSPLALMSGLPGIPK